MRDGNQRDWRYLPKNDRKYSRLFCFLLWSIDFQKVLIGMSFGCVFISIIALFLSQLINTKASFHHLRLSKRLIECLLIANILSGTYIHHLFATFSSLFSSVQSSWHWSHWHYFSVSNVYKQSQLMDSRFGRLLLGHVVHSSAVFSLQFIVLMWSLNFAVIDMNLSLHSANSLSLSSTRFFGYLLENFTMICMRRNVNVFFFLQKCFWRYLYGMNMCHTRWSTLFEISGSILIPESSDIKVPIKSRSISKQFPFYSIDSYWLADTSAKWMFKQIYWIIFQVFMVSSFDDIDCYDQKRK